MKIKLIFIYLLLGCTNAFAICSVSSSNELLKCIQNNIPDIVPDLLINNSSEKIKSDVFRLKNPELSIQTITSKSDGKRNLDLELRVSQEIELSKFKNARWEFEKNRIEILRNSNLNKIEEATIYGVQLLFQLRSIINQEKAIDFTIKQFQEVQKIYTQRPKLNPENEVTLKMIKMTIAQYELRRAEVFSEKERILSEFSNASDVEKETILKYLPNFKNLEINKNKVEYQSTFLKSLDLKLKQTKSEGEILGSSNFQSFTFELIGQNNFNSTSDDRSFGLLFKFPLTVFQSNEGEKSLNAIESIKDFRNLSAMKKTESAKLENLKNNFRKVIENIKSFSSEDLSEKNSYNVQSLFKQGTISGPLLIEYFRQYNELFEKKQSEQLKAVELFWQIAILEGRYNEINL